MNYYWYQQKLIEEIKPRTILEIGKEIGALQVINNNEKTRSKH